MSKDETPFKIDTDFLKKQLLMLLQTPSPTGFCQQIMGKVAHEVEQLGYQLAWTAKGCGMVTIPGESSHEKVLLYSAHVDTLGAMVRSIHDSGTLRLTPVGGFTMHAIEGEYCQIHTRDGRVYTGTILPTKPSVHASRAAKDLARTEEHMEIRLDEAVTSKEEVQKLGIQAGDFISFDARTVLLDNGYVKSRHLDDKASVAALLTLLELFHREKLVPKRTLKLFFSVYEEIGHGSAYIPSDVEEMIAVDMGVIGEDLSCTEMDVSICAKDSTGPYDYGMVTKLIELAKTHELSYAVDIYPHYGSDASAALSAGHDIRAALIGPGVHASHAMERTHLQAIQSTVTLLSAYALAPLS
ncbi:M42 family metallopeptidase [Marinicrinis sediminis]|uniref:M42 family metallopeptidase n=1 Tax=Marinicrinis sediminis TaxID=1652465 RepID=A0ABW5R938_9BACL